MPNIGTTELVLFLLIILIIFGAGKLPQVGEAMGKAIRGFKDAQKELTDTADEIKDAVSIEDKSEKK
ncbi:MAG: twin-arginine translocase TatA/TatE family subunit [Chloroflexota bacterium]|nr:twin-arginine translocase TatA/TatE family subunit [Anaerolineae bacterium]